MEAMRLMDFLRYEEFYLDTQEENINLAKGSKKYFILMGLFSIAIVIFTFYIFRTFWVSILLSITLFCFLIAYNDLKEQKKAEKNLKEALRKQWK